MTGLASNDGGANNITDSVTVKTFLNASGITTPVANLSDAGSQSMTINNALTTAPLFFVRSGRINSVSKLDGPGQRAYYWSRSAGPYSNVFGLEFNDGYILPSTYSDYFSRYSGMSLRCLYAI